MRRVRLLSISKLWEAASDDWAEAACAKTAGGESGQQTAEQQTLTCTSFEHSFNAIAIIDTISACHLMDLVLLLDFQRVFICV